MSEYILYEWAARDEDGWPWLFAGEPEYTKGDDSNLGVWDMESSLSDFNGEIAKMACQDVPPGFKRKVKSLDLAKGTVEYAGEAIHG